MGTGPKFNLITEMLILNPWLKPHEIHLPPSAMLVRDPGSRPGEGGMTSKIWLQVSLAGF